MSDKDRIDALIELLREAEVDRRDISAIYDLYQFVSIQNAVDTAQNFFNERGYSGPELEDLDDPDYVLE